MRLTTQKTTFFAIVHGQRAEGLPGVGEHGMSQKRSGERGRSWPFFRDGKYRWTSVKSEDIETTARKSEGSYYR
jgi:hypothetical protein